MFEGLFEEQKKSDSVLPQKSPLSEKIITSPLDVLKMKAESLFPSIFKPKEPKKVFRIELGEAPPEYKSFMPSVEEIKKKIIKPTPLRSEIVGESLEVLPQHFLKGFVGRPIANFLEKRGLIEPTYEPETTKEKIGALVGEIGGEIASVLLSVGLTKNVLTKIPSVARFASQYPKIFDIITLGLTGTTLGQIKSVPFNATFQERLKQAVIDLPSWTAWGVVGGIPAKEFYKYMPAYFTIGFVSSKLKGASWQDALYAGLASGVIGSTFKLLSIPKSTQKTLREEAEMVFKKYGAKDTSESSFRKLVLKYHPDKAGGSTQIMSEINLAYKILTKSPQQVQRSLMNEIKDLWNSITKPSIPTERAIIPTERAIIPKVDIVRTPSDVLKMTPEELFPSVKPVEEVKPTVEEVKPTIEKVEPTKVEQPVVVKPEVEPEKRVEIPPKPEPKPEVKPVEQPVAVKPEVEPEIPPELEPLAVEARKYKSAEEFINNIKGVLEKRLPSLRDSFAELERVTTRIIGRRGFSWKIKMKALDDFKALGKQLEKELSKALGYEDIQKMPFKLRNQIRTLVDQFTFEPDPTRWIKLLNNRLSELTGGLKLTDFYNQVVKRVKPEIETEIKLEIKPVIPQKILDYYKFDTLYKDGQFTERFFQDQVGRWWKIKPYNLETYLQFMKDEIGSFLNLENVISYIRYLQSIPKALPKYPLASFKVFKITKPDGKIKYELVQLTKKPVLDNIKDRLKPFSFNKYKIEDITDLTKNILYQEDVKYGLKQKFQLKPQPEGFQFREKESLIKFVKPSKTTLVKKYSYYEKGGKWIETDKPEKFWDKRDVIEVYIRQKDPTKYIAIYKPAFDPNIKDAWRLPIYSSGSPHKTPIEKQRIMEKLEKISQNKFKEELAKLKKEKKVEISKIKTEPQKAPSEHILAKGEILTSTITTGGGKTPHAGDWEVISETPKTIKLKLIKTPETIWGEIADYNIEVGQELVIKKDRWGFEKFYDGSFQFYPDQGGTPLYFEPKSKPKVAVEPEAVEPEVKPKPEPKPKIKPEAKREEIELLIKQVEKKQGETLSQLQKDAIHKLHTIAKPTEATKFYAKEETQSWIRAIKRLQSEKALSNITVARIKKALQIENIKTAEQPKLQKLKEFLEGLEKGDAFLSPNQVKALSDILKDIKKPDLVPKRIIIDKFGEKADLFPEGLTGRIANELFPTVDITEGHPLIARIVNKADQLLFQAEKEILRRDKNFDNLIKKAEKSRELPIGEKIKRTITPQNKEIFRALSGERVDLTPQERAVVAYLKNFFRKVRLDLAMERYRQHYITHLEKPLMEKILTDGLMSAVEDIFKLRTKETIPLNIMLELDNIIGSEKFFRFVLERKGYLKPTTDLRKILHTYSSLYEIKKALDKILPEGQAIVKLLLKPKSAIWTKRFLQNLKGRGLDFNFRTGKMGWLVKIADGIVDLGYLKLLGLNWESALKNILAGEVNSLIYEGIKKWIIGKQRFITSSQKAIKMALDYGILEGTYADYAIQGIKKLRKLEELMMIGMKVGEYEIRTSLFVAELTPSEWITGKISPERVREIKNVIAITQGIFSKTDSPLWLQTWYGRLLMQMNRWRITNFMLLRRIIKGFYEEQKAGIKYGKNAQRLTGAILFYLLATYISFELGKAGYKEAKKIVKAMGELLGSLIEFIPAMLRMITDNPTYQLLKEINYTTQWLLSYVGLMEEPYKIEIKKKLWETYIAPEKTIEKILGIEEETTGKTLPSLPSPKFPSLKLR